MPHGSTNKKVAISGATGFVGSALCAFLKINKFTPVKLTRNDFYKNSVELAEKLKGCSVIINLAGAPVAAKKWTEAYKQEILNSRVSITQKLVDAIQVMNKRPELLISTSAVGIYDSFEVHDEFSTNYANDFLSSVCQRWEAEAFKVRAFSDVRLCIVRLGVVLGKGGGALPRMIKPFKYGMGAKLGDGYQVFPFIHLNDLLSALWYLMQRKQCNGIYNLVAPQMISNSEITEALKQRTRGSLMPSVPEKFLRLLYGEGAEILLTGQKVKPLRLLKDGFHFSYPSFDDVADDLV